MFPVSLALRILPYLGVLLAGALLGWYLHPAATVQTVETQKLITVKGDTEIQTRDHIITVTKEVTAPDGTTTREETRSEDQAGTEKRTETSTEKVAEKKSVPAIPAAASLPNYSLGLKYWVTYADMISDVRTFQWREKVEVTAGYRLVSDLWLEGGLTGKGFALGLSIKF